MTELRTASFYTLGEKTTLPSVWDVVSHRLKRISYMSVVFQLITRKMCP